MKKAIFAIVLLLGVAASAADTKTFTGEISDSQCATNVHSKTRSHTEMTMHGTMGKDAAACVRKCIENGGQYVLVTGDKVYKLSDQKTPAEYAAQKVKIVGTLDKKSNTIQVQTISALK